MSLDYYIVIPAGKIPTFGQLLSALKIDKNGIDLVLHDDQANSKPCVPGNHEVRFDFSFNDIESNAEGWTHKFDDDDFAVSEDGWESTHNHEVVEAFKQLELAISRNDGLIHISFWEPESAFGGLCLIAATFVKNFGATFYDSQSGEIMDADTLVGIGNDIYSKVLEREGQSQNTALDQSADVSTSAPSGQTLIFRRILSFLGLR